MERIGVDALLSKLSLWHHERSPLLAAFLTTGQVAVGGADLDEVSDASVTVTLRRAIKHVQITSEQPIVTATFRPVDILAVWQATTFEYPQHDLLFKHFDEMLQIINKPGTPTITFWRATPPEIQ